MDKPLSLQVQETEKEVVEVINKSQLPAYVLKTILERIYNEIDKIEKEEIKKYSDKQIKKESDK